MSTRRNTPEILIEVLRQTQTVVKPTHVMYKVGIAYHTLIPYTEYLIEKGLLEKRDPRNTARSRRYIKTDKRTKYRLVITDKGREVLEMVDSGPLKVLFQFHEWKQNRND